MNAPRYPKCVSGLLGKLKCALSGVYEFLLDEDLRISHWQEIRSLVGMVQVERAMFGAIIVTITRLKANARVFKQVAGKDRMCSLVLFLDHDILAGTRYVPIANGIHSGSYAAK
ncbi:uncharacterized protein LACBIDRAFT_328030 [Laccaria bicolor S238N-H82]|uniref:Predicted protein n=1 Tax=Laccaria bicolor (strain S238N-H82 / ATCC MYA-4686) TaxID=486041 RepID=B0DE82_LACBS|nr:uncharacterized protein LACBIDRAFT_328030 [Laccaria bicolor S238N-H82]EDR07093.1 predicted protein [Laccaria bicolor S238N-H82]|eukprot:XP_001882024.1 predicted protein [Laccaria bicolor S238N-H82]